MGTTALSSSPASEATWKCSVCSHIYNAAADGGGKRFEDLPDGWKCSVCGAPKSAYRCTSGCTSGVSNQAESTTSSGAMTTSALPVKSDPAAPASGTILSGRLGQASSLFVLAAMM